MFSWDNSRDMWPRVVLVDLKCDFIGTRFEIVMVSSRADCEQYVPTYLCAYYYLRARNYITRVIVQWEMFEWWLGQWLAQFNDRWLGRSATDTVGRNFFDWERARSLFVVDIDRCTTMYYQLTNIWSSSRCKTQLGVVNWIVIVGIYVLVV